MTTKYPFVWEDIPEEELKVCMPEADRVYIRYGSQTLNEILRLVWV